MVDGNVELLWDFRHGEDVVGHEEGRGPDAGPHTPLTQRALVSHAFGLDESKNFFLNFFLQKQFYPELHYHINK